MRGESRGVEIQPLSSRMEIFSAELDKSMSQTVSKEKLY